MALHRSDLDERTCDLPGCDHTAHDGLFLHSTCHPGVPTWAEYQPKTGVLRVTCAECESVLAEIAVAPGLSPMASERFEKTEELAKAAFALQEIRYRADRLLTAMDSSHIVAELPATHTMKINAEELRAVLR